MNNFLKKIGALALGASLIAGVGVALLLPKSNLAVKTSAETPAVGSTYGLVKSTSDLVAGANYTVVAKINKTGAYYALSTADYQFNRPATEITVSNDSFTSTANILNLELGGNATDGWTFKTTNYLGTDGYLSSNYEGSYYGSHLFVVSNETTCSISFDDNNFATINVQPHYNHNKISFNYNLDPDPEYFYVRFTCYSQESMTNWSYVYLYKELTGAAAWATDFLATTATPCAESTQDHKTALEAVWDSTVTKYNLLSADDKKILKEATYDGTNIGNAVERYDTIIKKYDSSSETISNYINRGIPSSNKSMLWNDTTTITIIVAAFAGVSAVAIYFFVKKFKHK